MKYRVVFNNSVLGRQYFYKKAEAIAFQAVHGGQVQRNIGGQWYGY